MALLDTRKRVVAISYGDAISGTPADDAIHNTSTGARANPTTATGSFKCLNGGLGAKTTWRNTDDVTAEVAIECYVEGNDTTGLALETLPDWSEVYEVCGMLETVDTSTSGEETVTYSPMPTQPSGDSQAAVWADGYKRVVTGIVGNYEMRGTVGEPIQQTATIMGFTSIQSTAQANPAGGCVDPEGLIVLKSTDTFTIDGDPYKIRSFAFNSGNQIEKYYAINKKSYERNDFDATLEVTFLKEEEGIYATFEAGSKVPVNLVAGGADGKAVRVYAAQAEISNISEGEYQNKETITLTFSLQPSSGTAYDNYAIIFGFLGL